MKKPPEKRIHFALNVPNVITSTRIVLAITIICLLALGSQNQIRLGGILLIVAACTDFLDGFFARKLGQSSLAGSLFDIIADEILFIPCLVMTIAAGLFTRADGLMPLNPYLYAVPALAGGITVLAGVAIYTWKQRSRDIVFPTPPMVAKVNYWFWLAPLILAILDIGPDILMAVLMYLALITTMLSFYSYLKKGNYVFTD